MSSETLETPHSRRSIPSNSVGSSAVGSCGSAVLCAAALVLAAGKAEIVLQTPDASSLVAVVL